jgi:hypothetical protein
MKQLLKLARGFQNYRYSTDPELQTNADDFQEMDSSLSEIADLLASLSHPTPGRNYFEQ